MIITDGTTSFTKTLADEDMFPTIEKSSKRTAGGNIRSITGGERFKLNVRIRVSYTEFRSLMDLLTNNAANYFYTPEDTYTVLYSDITFPVAVNISNIGKEFKNHNTLYITFTVEANEYV